MPPDRMRRGIVLLAALVALGVVGTMLIAGYYAARAAQERGAAAARTTQLSAEADGAVADLVAAWDSAARFRQWPGASHELALQPVDPGASGRAWITRLSRDLYWINVHVADVADSALAGRAGALVLVREPVLDLPPDSGAIDPVVLAELAASAAVRIAPGASIRAPTAGLAYAQGSISINGGVGSGVLVVDGGVAFVAPTTFHGLIVATGSIEIASPGVVVTGGAIAAGGLSTNSLYDMELRSDSGVIADARWHAGRVEIVPGPSQPWVH